LGDHQNWLDLLIVVVVPFLLAQEAREGFGEVQSDSVSGKYKVDHKERYRY
jgi:hypothetical protein